MQRNRNGYALNYPSVLHYASGADVESVDKKGWFQFCAFGVVFCFALAFGCDEASTSSKSKAPDDMFVSAVDVNQPNELDAASYQDVQTAVQDAFLGDQCGNGQLDDGERCDPEMLGEENPRCFSNCQLNREPVVNNIVVQADGEITVGVWVECLFDVSDPDGDQLRTQVQWRVNDQTVAQGRSWQVSSALRIGSLAR